MKNKKSFDCLAYKDKVQAELYEKTKDMSHQEEIAFYQEKARNSFLGEWVAKMQQKTKQKEENLLK